MNSRQGNGAGYGNESSTVVNWSSARQKSQFHSKSLALTVLFLVGALLSVAVILHLKAEFSIVAPTARTCRATQTSDKFLVLAIGNSWVSDGKLDSGLTQAMNESGPWNVLVKSRGYPGERSKTIAENLPEFLTWAEENYPSYRRIILIEGGINDVITHAGPSFYANNMAAAVSTATQCGDRIAVLNVPEIAPERAHPQLASRARWFIYGLWNGEVGRSNPSEYNNALREKLTPHLDSGSTLLIDIRAMLGGAQFGASVPDGVHLPPNQHDGLAYKVGKLLHASMVGHDRTASK